MVKAKQRARQASHRQALEQSMAKKAASKKRTKLALRLIDRVELLSTLHSSTMVRDVRRSVSLYTDNPTIRCMSYVQLVVMCSTTRLSWKEHQKIHLILPQNAQIAIIVLRPLFRFKYSGIAH